MKLRKLSKIAAVAMAMVMCVPTTALATQGGSFDTSFDVYAPVLTVDVPLKLDVRVNPMADSSDSGVKQFSVASNSIDIVNATVDEINDKGIPVNVTIKAAIQAGEDVLTEYNNFTPDATSDKKKINLNLAEATTPAVVAAITPAFDSSKKLDLKTFSVTTAAQYVNVLTGNQAAGINRASITSFGSSLSMDIAAPTTTAVTPGQTFTGDPSLVTPKVGSFAVVGVANSGANWTSADLAVGVTYSIRVSNPRSIKTPELAAVTTSASSDASISLTNLGEATVAAMALHNNSEGAYGDVVWDADKFTVTYPVASPGTATIKIDKNDAYLGVLATDEYKGKAQDLCILLSDGRMIVSTLTVN